MKILFVFDHIQFSVSDIPEDVSQMDLLPLTGDCQVIDTALSKLRNVCKEINVLPSAETIDDKASVAREQFVEWAAALGDIKIGPVSLRERLMMPDGGVSAWWFGLLADKDPCKNPVFLRILQTGAVLQACEGCKKPTVVLALSDINYREQLRWILSGHAIHCYCIKTRKSFSSILAGIKNFLMKRKVFRSIYQLCKTLIRMRHLKKVLPAGRRFCFDNALLFFAYFPSLDKEAAKQGVFRNKNALPLQDLCRENDKPIIWLLTYANYDDYSFKDAVQLAEQFIGKGEHAFFYQEFLSLKGVLRALCCYFRVVLTWKKIRSELRSETFTNITGIDYAQPFLMEVLDDSFYGFHSLNGMLHYEACKNIFASLTGFTHILYYCEMMGWEYALNAAKRQVGITTPSIGYQHAAISRNYLHMFHSRQELNEQNSAAGIPMPDILASNGPLATAILGVYYHKIETLEALRYLYMDNYIRPSSLQRRIRTCNNFVLLICTNIEIKESLTLARLIKATFSEEEESVQLWFKGHPALSMQKIFAEVGLEEGGHYQIKEGPVADLLSQSNAVLVGASTVALEALAMGSEVLVYINAETLNQSPLVGFDEYYHKIYDPAGMRQIVNSLRSGINGTSSEKKRDFIQGVWNLNPALEAWRKVLGLDGVQYSEQT